MKNLVILAVTIILLNITSNNSVFVNAFSECYNSNVPDPNIPGISNCIQWLAYAQAVHGINVVNWCSNANNYQKCCITCENYLSVNQCSDKASESDCMKSAHAGLCELTLFNTMKLKDICPKSCGACPYASLTCDNLKRSCNLGNCLSVNLYSVSTVQCLCPSDNGGAYCQQQNVCKIANPCLNNGVCIPLYEDDAMYKCSCPYGFTGKNCQNNILGCSAISCYNGGSCQVNADGSPYCLCSAQYTGLRCQNYVGGCHSNPCMNGGTCSPTANSGYFCFCQPNYTGKNCNYAITYDMCLNGDKNSTLCSVWSLYKFCDFTYLYESTPVPLYCPVTCQLCNNFCQDSTPDCVLYARLNLCGVVNAQNPDLCRRSCNNCNIPINK